MPYHVTCACGRLLVVPDERAGSTIRCPRCDRSIPVPPAGSAESHPGGPETGPEPVSDSAPQLPVIEPISRQRWEREIRQRRSVSTVYGLGIAMMLVALVNVVPLILVVLDNSQARAPARLELWAYAIIFSALLQAAYLLYLVQIPDWSTLRVISVLTLLHATAYAMLAAIRILDRPTDPISVWMGLNAGRFTVGQQAGWCLIMVLLYGALCYLASRTAGRWQRTQNRG